MKVIFFASDKEREQVLAHAFLKGVRKHGCEGEVVPLHGNVLSPTDEADCYVMFGVKSGLLYREMRPRGLGVVYLDKGYCRSFARSDFIRVAVNRHQPIKFLERNKMPDDRLKALDLDIKPWRTKGRHIIFAGSSEKYHAFYDLVYPTEYAEDVIAMILSYDTGREVVYRPKPSWSDATEIEGSRFSTGAEPINELLKGAWALVTHGSNACFEAMVAGVPSVVLGEGVAASISSTDLHAVRKPRVATDEARYQLLANLAYCQWTIPEFASGLAWDHIRKELYDA